jgi:hypothetical protein
MDDKDPKMEWISPDKPKPSGLVWGPYLIVGTGFGFFVAAWIIAVIFVNSAIINDPTRQLWPTVIVFGLAAACIGLVIYLLRMKAGTLKAFCLGFVSGVCLAALLFGTCFATGNAGFG